MTMIQLPETTSHLRRLKSGLIVPATSGKRTFVTERAMFPGFFDSDFRNYGTDVTSDPLPETPSDLYEMTADGDFKTLLGSFGPDPEPLFWRSQDQILSWIEKHPDDLHPQGWATFFPFVVGKKRFVADVDRDSRSLEAYIRRFGIVHVWSAEFRSRLLLTQLVT